MEGIDGVDVAVPGSELELGMAVKVNRRRDSEPLQHQLGKFIGQKTRQHCLCRNL